MLLDLKLFVQILICTILHVVVICGIGSMRVGIGRWPMIGHRPIPTYESNCTSGYIGVDSDHVGGIRVQFQRLFWQAKCGWVEKAVE